MADDGVAQAANEKAHKKNVAFRAAALDEGSPVERNFDNLQLTERT